MPAKYAYEYGKRWNVKTPRRDIKYIVRAFHVGASYEDVESEIQKRVDGAGPEFTPAIRRQCLSYARCVHFENRQLYQRVMRG